MAFTECSAGTYNKQTGASDSSACSVCPPGTANPVPGSANLDPAEPACRPCLPGSYASAAGQGRCALCPAGSFSSGMGSTECSPCMDGYLCVEGASAPQPCPGGTHADQTVLAAVGFLSDLASECIVCVCEPNLNPPPSRAHSLDLSSGAGSNLPRVARTNLVLAARGHVLPCRQPNSNQLRGGHFQQCIPAAELCAVPARHVPDRDGRHGLLRLCTRLILSFRGGGSAAMHRGQLLNQHQQ